MIVFISELPRQIVQAQTHFSEALAKAFPSMRRDKNYFGMFGQEVEKSRSPVVRPLRYVQKRIDHCVPGYSNRTSRNSFSQQRLRGSFGWGEEHRSDRVGKLTTKLRSELGGSGW